MAKAMAGEAGEPGQLSNWLNFNYLLSVMSFSLNHSPAGRRLSPAGLKQVDG